MSVERTSRQLAYMAWAMWCFCSVLSLVPAATEQVPPVISQSVLPLYQIKDIDHAVSVDIIY